MKRAPRLAAVLAALLLLAAPAALRAQEHGEGPRGPAPRERMVREGQERQAFEVLLRHRRELALTEAQVSRLEAISRGLELRNRPLRARLAAEFQRFRAETRARMERMSAEERHAELRRMRGEGARRLPAPMRPLVGEMRRNIAQAQRQAQGVLTPAQKRRARVLLRERAQERREELRERRREMRGMRGEPFPARP